MSRSTHDREGMADFRGYHVWYRICGERDEPGRLPLLCLHGGPGISHDYLEPLAELASNGRRVIFYDQLGNGRSDHPHGRSLWTVQLFLDELATVRRALGLERLHLLGQSWGGMLALEHALTKPGGIASLILADSLASVPQWISEANRLRAALPAAVRNTLTEHEASGTTDAAAYQEAMMVFYRRHVCRLDPWPACLLRSFEALERNPEVYRTMWGASEFHAAGILKTWDIIARLGEIDVPTLVLAGRYDEATSLVTETLCRGIPGSECVMFENSAHMPHLEEPQRYMSLLDDFLQRVETTGSVNT